MAGFKEQRTVTTLMWLDMYGFLREGGVSIYGAQQWMDGGSEQVAAALQEMDAAAAENPEQAKEIGNTVASTIMGIGLAIIEANVVAGIIVAVVGALTYLFTAIFAQECDEHHCSPSDPKTKTGERTLKWKKRAVVGRDVPDDSWWNLEPSGYCKYKMRRCSFVRYLHDGMVAEGIDFSLPEGDPGLFGHVRGANAITGGGQYNVVEWWRTNAEAKPLKEKGGDIPAGKRDRPWENPENTYYYRAWRVENILKWMEDHVLCRTMKCMQEALLGMKAQNNDSEFNQKRRRGSRWYATIVWMMRDVYEAGKSLGWDRFEQIARNAGANDTVIADLHKIRDGYVFNPEEVPWEFWPFVRHFTWWQLRGMLVGMKPYLPTDPLDPNYMPEARQMSEPEPVGQEQRKVKATLAPMFVPVRHAIIFDRSTMEPIPAKFGSRLPSWPVIALGVGAAAFGAYVIYKIFEPKPELPQLPTPNPWAPPPEFFWEEDFYGEED